MCNPQQAQDVYNTLYDTLLRRMRPAAGGAALVSDLRPWQRGSHGLPAVLLDSRACA